MTERFTIEKDYDCDGYWEYCYQDNETYRRFNFADDFCHTDFLELVNAIINNLRKENSELKYKYDEQSNEKMGLEENIDKLLKDNKELKQEIKGFEGCSHNWGILYDEAKNKVEELSKENQELKYHLNRTEKELKEYKEFMSLG